MQQNCRKSSLKPNPFFFVNLRTLERGNRRGKKLFMYSKVFRVEHESGEGARCGLAV